MSPTPSPAATVAARASRRLMWTVLTVVAVALLVIVAIFTWSRAQLGPSAGEGLQELLDHIEAEGVVDLDAVFSAETAEKIRNADEDELPRLSWILLGSREARERYGLDVEYEALDRSEGPSAGTNTYDSWDARATITLEIAGEPVVVEWVFSVTLVRPGGAWADEWRINSIFSRSASSTLEVPPIPSHEPGEADAEDPVGAEANPLTPCEMNSLAISTTLAYEPPAPGGCVLPSSIGTDLIAPELAAAVERSPGSPGVAVDGLPAGNPFLPSAIGTCWERQCPIGEYTFEADGAAYRAFMVVTSEGTGRIVSLLPDDAA